MFTVCSQYSVCLYKIKYRTTLVYTGNVDPVWTMFDLAPEGRGDFQPKLDYTSGSGK